jgi:Holliday junction resolvase RusA-like endonuclease
VVAETIETFNHIIDIKIEDFELQPYVRMTQRSKFADSNAQNYIKNQAEFQLLVRNYVNLKNYPMAGDHYIPDTAPFMLCAYVFTGKRLHRCDLDNIIKAVLDGTQGLIFKNDQMCDAILASRHEIEPEEKPYLLLYFVPWSGSWGTELWK